MKNGESKFCPSHLLYPCYLSIRSCGQTNQLNCSQGHGRPIKLTRRQPRVIVHSGIQGIESNGIMHQAEKRPASRKDFVRTRAILGLIVGYFHFVLGIRNVRKVTIRNLDRGRENSPFAKERWRPEEQEDRGRSHFAVWNLIGGIPVMDGRLSSGSRRTKRNTGRSRKNESKWRYHLLLSYK